MYYQYDEKVLKKLQNIQKNILKDFQKICDKYEIKYFAIGGTLIGAVRHEGFIPWDDDIDLGMLREDFDKFLAIPNEEYNENYYLCTPEKENNYYSIIPKFALKNTAYVTELAEKTGVNPMGIFVEIFVFENVSPDYKIRKRQIFKVNWIKNLHFQVVAKKVILVDKGVKAALKYFVKSLLDFYVKIFNITTRKTNGMFLDATNLKHITGYVAYFGDGTTEDFLSEIDNLFPLIEKKFEDIVIMIPNNYHELLTQAYGDYMKLPPIEDRWNQAPTILQFPHEAPIYLKKGNDGNEKNKKIL